MQPRVSSPLPWIVALAILSALCIVVGLIVIAVGVANQGATCETTHGADTYVTGCPGDSSGILWGSILAGVGLVFTAMTLAVGAVVAALRGRAVPVSTPTLEPQGESTPELEPEPATPSEPRTNGDSPTGSAE
jgi:hypothetical protein